MAAPAKKADKPADLGSLLEESEAVVQQLRYAYDYSVRTNSGMFQIVVIRSLALIIKLLTHMAMT